MNYIHLLLLWISGSVTITVSLPNRPVLRGVTIRNWPYADRLNDRYEGFVVDLMQLIGNKIGFDFRLYFSPDGKYGTEYNGHINGMIGEVFRHKADFAIADLTVTESRRRYVDFTDPFLENQLAAIIRRDDAAGLRTLDDLVTLNEITRSTDVGLRSRRGVIAYGTYRTGSTFYHLSRSRDPVAVQMYSWMVRHPEALVTSAKEGFDRVNAGRYAFIVESTFAEYLTGIYCNLTMLYDTRSLYPRQFAIALAKGSPYLPMFNKAIHELRADGTIRQLQEQYWSNRCVEESVKPVVVVSSPKIEPVESKPPPRPVEERRRPPPPPTPPEEEPRINSLNSAANAIKIEWAGNGHNRRKNVDYEDVQSHNRAAAPSVATISTVLSLILVSLALRASR